MGRLAYELRYTYDPAGNITQIDDGIVTPVNAFLDFSANSTSGATAPPSLAIIQHFAGTEHAAVLLVAAPEHDPVPAFRALADGVRLPGDS